VRASCSGIRSWTTFARTGDPNAGGEAAWHWPPYTQADARHLVFAERLDLQSESARADLDCDFWDELYPDEFL
jgi:carboxylesterase type B